MPISKTISSTSEVRRRARHAGRPVSWSRASLRPLAAPGSPAGGLGSPTSREPSEPRRHPRAPAEDLRGNGTAALAGQLRSKAFAADGPVPFDAQPPFAAREADAVDPLHGGRQVGQHAQVRGQRGQAERRQRGDPAAEGALDAAGLGRLDVDARQTLQAEGVFAPEHLGAAEHVVELAEADGAFQVRVLRRGPVGVWGGHDDDRNVRGVRLGGRRGARGRSLTR